MCAAEQNTFQKTNSVGTLQWCASNILLIGSKVIHNCVTRRGTAHEN